jgi:hypothetical protein
MAIRHASPRKMHSVMHLLLFMLRVLSQNEITIPDVFHVVACCFVFSDAFGNFVPPKATMTVSNLQI